MVKKAKYSFYTTNEITPAGWVKKQLEIQAAGLNGNLDKVWRDIRESAWIGGNSEGWERVPYWLDGFIPMAYFLQDKDLINRAKKYIDAIIERQNEDGWICPCNLEERRNYDVWAALLIAKILALYADCSGDKRIEGVLSKCLFQLNEHIDKSSLRNWAAARWYEGLIPIYWLYERTHEEWLPKLANKLQVQGFDWKKIFDDGVLDDCVVGWDYISHVVNLAMMLKSEALMSLFSEKEKKEFTKSALEYLENRSGTAFGHFNGDECLSSGSPIQGTELCGVVEAMYSYEILFSVTGDCEWLDRLERLAFNALPAAISPDMWSHQYDQMVNQVACYPMSKQPFRNNDRFAHTFGLEPHFGCCTSNFGQGWPKLLLSAFMKGEDEIISSVLIPARLKTTIRDTPVEISLDTEYPFRDTLSYTIKTAAPIDFTFMVRIPNCVKAAYVQGEKVQKGTLARFEKKWNGTEKIEIQLEFETTVTERPNGLVCVNRGPLLYSVAIQERWERVEYERDGVERKYPYCDYYIYPESKWNYCLTDDSFKVVLSEYDTPFDNKNPPVYMYAKMAEIEWGFNNGHCDPLPKNNIPSGQSELVKLIPYGCSNLRITEVPFYKQK